MSPNDRDENAPAEEDSIGEQNVERLVERAYQPQTPDPGSVRRVEEHVLKETRRSPEVDEGTLPPVRPAGRSRRRNWRALLPWAVALSLLVVVGLLIVFRGGDKNTDEPSEPTVYRDGPLMWIDGQAYVATGSDSSQGKAAPGLSPLQDAQPQDGRATAKSEPLPHWVGGGGLTARKRQPDPSGESAETGQSIATKPGQRRRVSLADGSVLYINENSTVRIDARRRISLAAGDVFLDVATTDASDDPKFVVETPHRNITALGTEFAVSVAETGDSVVVMQGRVQVDGFDKPVLAGQQLRLAADDKELRVSPAPRAAHLLDWTRDLVAAAESRLTPGSKYDGGALVAVDPKGQKTQLELRKLHIDVHIEDGFARTTIDQTYFNRTEWRMEGTFYFPLPADASLSRLAMYVGPRLMEGGMVERNYGRDVFETIKYRSLDPALLEWIDGTTFKMRVFPLEGRQEKRIVLSYTQRLDTSYGRTRYRFPAGHNLDVVRNWSVKIHVERGAGMHWACSSHELKETVFEDDLVLTGLARSVKPDRDVVVYLRDDRQAAKQAQPARFSAVKHERARYLMLRYRPKFTAPLKRQRRDWIFLFEASADRNPLLARTQIEVLRSLLDRAEDDDTFAILTAGSRIHGFAIQRLPVTQEHLAKAIKFLEMTHLVGALDLEKALAAAGSYAKGAKNPVLVHIGSGTPILGERQADKLADKLPQATQYIGIGVGRRWNRGFMKLAASRSGGDFTQINPDEPIRWRAFELLSRLNAPRLLGLKVKVADKKLKFLLIGDSLADGEELCAIARLAKSDEIPKSVTVSGRIDGQDYQREIPVVGIAPDAGYLPRIWAKLEIDRLLAADAAKNKDRIIKLSKAMYVMSPFTSLLVLENEEMYKEFKVDRGRKDHWALYPCPQRIKVVEEPLPPGQQEDKGPKPDMPRKRTPVEVLRTLLVRGQGTSYTSVSDVVGIPGQDLNPAVAAPDVPYRKMTWPVWKVRRLMQRLNSLAEGAPHVTPRKASSLQPRRGESGPIPFGNPVDRPVKPWGTGGGGNEPDFDSLIKLIQGTIAPDSWDQDTDGDGSITGFEGNLSLVISQTHDVHDQIEDLLYRWYYIPHVQETQTGRFSIGTGINSDLGVLGNIVLGERRFSIGGAVFTRLWPVESATVPVLARAPFINRIFPRLIVQEEESLLVAGGRLRETLKERTAAKFIETPLQEVLEYFEQRHDIDIELDMKTTKAMGVDTETRITRQLNGIELRSALKLILNDLGLGYLIYDDVLLITTSEAINTALATGKRLILDRPPLVRASRRFPISEWYDPLHERKLVAHLARRIQEGSRRRDVLYSRDADHGDYALRRKLVLHTPGINTTWADVLAVLDQEVAWKQRPQPGKIDKRARQLIETARRGGWRSVKLRDDKNRVVLDLRVDGQGRYRYDRQTSHGIRETVVCDGQRLLHLYPELGIGARREVSRFHRAQLRQLVPWALSPVDDLALDADLRMIDERVVAVVPRGMDVAKGADGKPARYVRWHLAFDEAGRLSERRAVEIPSGKTLARETYGPDGTVRTFNREGKQIREKRYEVADAEQPDLRPALKELVVLPMPLRTREHVVETIKRDGEFFLGELSEEDALRLIMAAHMEDPDEMQDVVDVRFFARGDRRLGFYTLMLSCGGWWSRGDTEAEGIDKGKLRAVRRDPVADHPDSPLARYIATELSAGDRPDRDEFPPVIDGDGFIGQLSKFRRLYLLADWYADEAELSEEEKAAVDTEWNLTVTGEELKTIFDFIHQCPSAVLASALLNKMAQLPAADVPRKQIASALDRLEKDGVLNYATRYELARSLLVEDREKEARDMFLRLYQQTFRRGTLPPIDKAFLKAFGRKVNLSTKDDAGGTSRFGGGNSSGGFFAVESRPGDDGAPPKDKAGLTLDDLFRQTCDALIAQRRRETALTLVWQCQQLGERTLAEELITTVLTDVPAEDQVAMTMLALDFSVHTGHFDWAETQLEKMLGDPRFDKLSSLRRLASWIASRRGQLARSIRYHEQAISLEYDGSVMYVNIEQVRADYQRLLLRYRNLAGTMAALDETPTADLVARVLRAADRWRSLEDDVTIACMAAGDVFQAMGQTDLAWDYLATPLAMKPNEAAPWRNLAHAQRDAGNVELASRAFAAAFAIEPTNAEILWEHAQMLGVHGRAERAAPLYRRIAKGKWQPRFNWIQQAAKRLLTSD